MKRIIMLAYLPVLLSALETVNLIKEHSFEKNSEVWNTESGSEWGAAEQDSAQASSHDSTSAFDGSFSASGDTRKVPAWFVNHSFDSALVINGEFLNKKVSDLDSLIWHQKVLPRQGDNPEISTFCFVIGFFLDAGSSYWKEAGYFYQNPFFPDIGWPRWNFIRLDMPDDTSWKNYERNLKSDMLEFWNLSPETTVDSILLVSWGHWYGPDSWFGQKVYWDDIRLMGYADYDVGVKEILSGDSLEVGKPYAPKARIKNFGRQAAPEFYVIAEIWEGENRIYYDSLAWSLESDTEDTVSFAQFILEPPLAPSYRLAVRTVMEPDESDADDEIEKPLVGAGVSEEPLEDNLNLKVKGFYPDGVLRASYSLPSGKHGTLTLYTTTGRRLERMTVNGSGSVEFSKNLSSGVYLIQLKSGGQRVTRKAVVIE